MADYGEAIVELLHHRQFFDKLVLLKIESGQLLTTILRSYIDDFMFFLVPLRSAAGRTVERFGNLLYTHGVDEKEEKREMPEEEMILIGNLCSSVSMDMKTPESTKFKAKQAIFKALHLGYISLKEYESLVGRLEHVGSNAWPGKAFVRRMRNRLNKLIAENGRIHMIVVLTDWELRDFRWWVDYMDQVDGLAVIDMLDLTLPTDEIYFDAATNGARDATPSWDPAIGVWYKGHWLCMRVPDLYTHIFAVRDAAYEKLMAIAHFEAFAIVMGLHAFRHLIGQRTRIMLRTDSKHVEAALLNKSSKDEFLQSVVRWVCMFAVEEHCRPYVCYVNTKANGVADALSRFNMVAFRERANAQCREHGWHLQQQRFPCTLPNICKW